MILSLATTPAPAFNHDGLDFDIQRFAAAPTPQPPVEPAPVDSPSTDKPAPLFPDTVSTTPSGRITTRIYSCDPRANSEACYGEVLRAVVLAMDCGAPGSNFTVQFQHNRKKLTRKFVVQERFPSTDDYDYFNYGRLYGTRRIQSLTSDEISDANMATFFTPFITEIKHYRLISIDLEHSGRQINWDVAELDNSTFDDTPADFIDTTEPDNGADQPAPFSPTPASENLFEQQRVDRKRRSDECWTPLAIVQEMLATPDMQQAIAVADQKFFDPCAGSGNILMEILRQKLNRHVQAADADSMLAILGSVYGFELMADNVEHCRANLLTVFSNHYRNVYRTDLPADVASKATAILVKNIVQADCLAGADDTAPVADAEPDNDSTKLTPAADEVKQEIVEATKTATENPGTRLCSVGAPRSLDVSTADIETVMRSYCSYAFAPAQIKNYLLDIAERISKMRKAFGEDNPNTREIYGFAEAAAGNIAQWTATTKNFITDYPDVASKIGLGTAFDKLTAMMPDWLAAVADALPADKRNVLVYDNFNSSYVFFTVNDAAPKEVARYIEWHNAPLYQFKDNFRPGHDIHDWLLDTIKHGADNFRVVRHVTVDSVNAAFDFISMKYDSHVAPMKIGEQDYQYQQFDSHDYTDMTLNIREYVYDDWYNSRHFSYTAKAPAVFEIDDFNHGSGSFAEICVNGEITVIHVNSDN